jgi:cupin 2 domain-containing protein
MQRGNLHDDGPAPATGERFDTLARVANVQIERITSSAAPDPTPYVQAQDEWVVLLAGEATLDVGGIETRLAAGDWLLLPAGTPHRVLATTAGARWLAVHVHPVSGVCCPP